MAEETVELTPDIAATVIQEAWPKVSNVTVFDIWADSEGVGNVRAQWDIEGMTIAQNVRMAARKGKIEIV